MRAKTSVFYDTDGQGRWWRTETEPQCQNRDLGGLPCQGVFRHEGPHWAYKPDGSYAYWLNQDDPHSIEEDIGAAWIPPDHETYIHPKDKLNESYRNFRSHEEVVDPKIKQRLENNDAPEQEASIDRPLSEEEVQRLKDEGVL